MARRRKEITMKVHRLMLVPTAALALAAPAQAVNLEADGPTMPSPQLGIGVGDDTPFARAPAADPAPTAVGSSAWAYAGVGITAALVFTLVGGAVTVRRQRRPGAALS
jgi:hypothetical protein